MERVDSPPRVHHESSITGQPGGGEMSHSRHDGQGVRLVIDLTLWMNVKLKDVTLLEGGVERVLSCHV